MLEPIDNFLNNYTMYRVVLYGLIAILVYSFGLTVFGMLPFTVVQLVASTIIIIASCLASNFLFAKMFGAPTNIESGPITALIIILIMQPVASVSDGIILALVAAIAMASKYILAIKTKHLFNPAAVGALVGGYLFSAWVSWWVGSMILLPVVAVVGLLVVRKIRRFSLFFSFALAGILSILFFGWMNGAAPAQLFVQIFTSWPLLFFAAVMLTEPLTTPPTRNLQMMYGALVGFLFGFPFHIGFVYSSPELALILGNVFSYIVSPKQKLILTLKTMACVGDQMYEFIFSPSQKLNFAAGQYVEWTLPHLAADGRGNRRFFTIASSPTEPEIHLGVKIPENSSSFKRALLQLKTGDKAYVGQLSGDFTLPPEQEKKLVFIAGGIGVTPFRSMIKYLIDTNQKRDIAFFYAASHPDECMYKELFSQAKKLGVKVMYVITRPEAAPLGWDGKVGRITPEMIQEEVKDYTERYYYISGPHAMVTAYEKVLATLGVPSKQIIVDYFPGF